MDPSLSNPMHSDHSNTHWLTVLNPAFVMHDNSYLLPTSREDNLVYGGEMRLREVSMHSSLIENPPESSTPTLPLTFNKSRMPQSIRPPEKLMPVWLAPLTADISLTLSPSLKMSILFIRLRLSESNQVFTSIRQTDIRFNNVSRSTIAKSLQVTRLSSFHHTHKMGQWKKVKGRGADL